MTEKIDKKHSADDLERLFTEGESADQEVFAEQRSNVLLVSGEHYNKRRSNLFRRLRDNTDLSQEQKLRITKNHIQKICKKYVNNILAQSPGVGFSPKDEKSHHDQKVAKLHHSVWRDAVAKLGIDDQIDDWCDNFVTIGEVGVKIFFDDKAGEIVGHEQATDGEGNPQFDEFGQATPDETVPIYSGKMNIEEFYGFNLIRPANCEKIIKAPWLALRKTASQKECLEKFGDTPENKQIFQESNDHSFIIFDASKGGYQRAQGNVLIQEFYFRPCPQYPKGYFFFKTKHGIFREGELPGGIFPLEVEHMDKIPTTPRGRSPVKTMRPYQAEINRAASKIAEHQITIGDDKIVLQNGSKMTSGAVLPGIRGINVTGSNPTILSGRDGSQYLAYMQAQIEELYQVMMVAEDEEEISGQTDPYVLLYRSARQKKHFQRYIKRFQKFLIKVAKTYLSLAKFHLSEEDLINAIGREEQVNIPEFRMYSDLNFEVLIEDQSDDIETKMGKQLTINHALQYIGNQLSREDIGKFMRQMPFSNFEASFDDMTINYDSAQNDILALDRGERPPVHQNDDHVYMSKRLTLRTRQADFPFMSPQIQQNYHDKIDLHDQFEAQIQDKIQRAKDGYIPTGGYMVVCDLYTTDPKNPGKTQRARIPYESIVWLIKQLETQGQSLEQLSQVSEAQQANIADKLSEQKMMAAQAAHGNPNQGMGQGAAPPQQMIA